jgi:hypothetical protein
MGGRSDDEGAAPGRSILAALGSASSTRYELIGEIGTGATANVFRVRDRVLGVDVALKRMHQVGAEARLRLKREFRTVRDIFHANLVRLYDLIVDDTDTFFTMELVAGKPITELALDRTTAEISQRVPQVCRAFLQLARGVSALHESQIIHRDIKPANVLVETAGRVVLVDYGFASPVQTGLDTSEDGSLVGTLPYMAPERFWGSQPTPASDWYSVGVLVADLLLGAPLFEGSLRELLRQKDRPPTTLRDRVQEIPPELDTLVCRLLQREPQGRPEAKEILATLAALTETSGGSADARPAAAPFVGRVAELARLRHLISGAEASALIRVEGPSGIGKTALVQQVLASLPKEVLVFRGRCHPREHVPFATLDEVMDQLSRHIGHLSARERGAIRPAHADTLVMLFPALERTLPHDEPGQRLGNGAIAPPPVPGLLDAASVSAADPHERRKQAAVALRELWRAVADRWPIVIWIDDVQWADRDGLSLLHELLSGPRPPAIHWILCERTSTTPGGSTGSSPTLARASGPAIWDDTTLPRFDLSLGGLSNDEAEMLARAHGLDDASVPHVVAEAGGSPLFVGELVHYLHTAPKGESSLSLSRVLDARISSLEPTARRVLQYLSLTTEPLSAGDLQTLAGTEVAAQGVAFLELAGLVRATPGPDPRSANAFEPLHDRIRERVVAGVGPAAARVHLDLAALVESRPARATARLAFHYRAAGDPRALEHTLAAARETARALAFGEAANLLEMAVELHPRPVPSNLYAEWADVLLAAGQCGLAAKRYLLAATAAAEEGRSGEEVRRYNRQAGEQFLYGGQIAEGRAVLIDALRSYGIRIPRSPLLAAIVRRVRFLLKRRFDAGPPKPSKSLSAEQRAERIDALCNIAKGTIMVEHVLGDALVLNALLEAIALGDRRRLFWPLALEAASEANIGNRLSHRPMRLVERAFRLAGPDPSPSAEGWLYLCRGTVAYFQARWRDATHDLEAANHLFRTRCVGATYEFATANIFRIAALAFQGRFQEITTLLPELAQWARDRGNVYAAAMFGSGHSVYAYLASDEPARAIDDADRGLAEWRASGFTSQNFQHFLTHANARLYADNAWDAWRLVLATWPSLRRAHFLDLDCIGLQLRELRARVALTAAARPNPPRDLAEWSKVRLLRVAAKDARSIRRSRLPHAAATAAVLEAVSSTMQGDGATAGELLSEAIAGFDASGMAHLRECARLGLAMLGATGDEAERAISTARERQAIAALEGLGVKHPDRFRAVLVPLPAGDPAG